MSKRVSVLAVVPAAGVGSRLKESKPKALVEIEGVPILIRTLRTLSQSYPFTQMIVPVDPSFEPEARKLIAKAGIRGVELCAGGATRAESVRNGLLCGAGEFLVLVHDVARPFVPAEDIRAVIAEAARWGGAILAQQATSTIKEADPKKRWIEHTRDRRRTWLAQTPQVFRSDWLCAAYKKLGRRAAKCTDEAAICEAVGRRVRVVPGSPLNLKITTPDDLKLARALVRMKGGYESRNRL